MAMEFMKNNQSQQPTWLWICIVILFLALSRLIPHPPNFTPIGAMALLAGAYLNNLRLALIIPLLAMIISDAIIGFHSSLLYVYVAVLAITAVSHLAIQQRTFLKLTLGAVASAFLFYLITNFGAWLSHDMYPHNIAGLQQAYLAGIPFFRNTLVSHLLFTAVGFYALNQLPVKQSAHN